jgi:LysR family hydrogen peroxide-inducible transcriptional activator
VVKAIPGKLPRSRLDLSCSFAWGVASLEAMDLRQLNAVVAVADHGSFSAAADALHTVQSNVSTHVARLERELGVSLIDRSDGCRLTEEGQAVVERARRINLELEALVTDVAAMRHEVVGSVRIGMIGTTARWLVPALLPAMAERHPKVHLVVVEATSTSLEPRLTTGSLDLAIVNLPPDPTHRPYTPGDELIAQPMFDEDLVLVVPSGHPLAGRREIDLTETDGLELLLPAPGTAFRDEIDSAVAASGVVWHAIAEIDGVRTIASLTFEGYGPAVVPATALPEWLQGDWRALSVRGLPRRSVGLARRRKGRPGAPARAVIDLLQEIVDHGVDTRPGIHPSAVPSLP